MPVDNLPSERDLPKSPVRQLVAVIGLLVVIGIGLVLVLANTTAEPSFNFGSPDQAFQAGLDALATRDVPQAKAAINFLESQPGYDRHARLLQGAVLLRNGHPELALQHFAAVAPEGELRQPALLYAGEALYKTGQFQPAETCFQQLRELKPNEVDAIRWLAAIAYDCGRMDKAVALLNELVKHVPDDPSPHRLMGLIHKDFEQYPIAIQDYQHALERNPSPHVRQEVAAELATCLIAERNYEAALTVLAETSSTPRIKVMQSRCLWSLGQQEEAIAQLKGLQNSDNPEVLFWRAHVLIEQGRTAEAVPLLKRGLDQEPHDTTARYQLALAYRALGDQDQSQSEIEKFERSKQLLDELTVLSEQAMKEPYDSTIREQMADVCDQLQRPKMAAAWRKAASSMK